ncbi:MAG: response regulator [Candidatus Thermoplasmatota archaeon]
MTSEHKQPKQLMIVDDDPDILISLRMLFEAKNINVVTAENGAECIKKLEDGFEGIILLDLMMPVLDGIETIKQMITEGFIEKNIIIVLTAKKIQGEEFNEIYPYIFEYITKPFDMDTLVSAVEKAMHSKPKKLPIL